MSDIIFAIGVLVVFLGCVALYVAGNILFCVLFKDALEDGSIGLAALGLAGELCLIGIGLAVVSQVI